MCICKCMCIYIYIHISSIYIYTLCHYAWLQQAKTLMVGFPHATNPLLKNCRFTSLVMSWRRFFGCGVLNASDIASCLALLRRCLGPVRGSEIRAKQPQKEETAAKPWEKNCQQQGVVGHFIRLA